jgi:DNA-binding transcriptional regulator GbsR (MarR family)
MESPVDSARSQATSQESSSLSDLEVGVIDLFVSAVRMLGIPKSVGEIYGLLFICRQPLALDALVEKLQISKGSASQGLKLLRTLGAVRVVYIAGDRRDHYTAEAELKRLVSGLIREELHPRMESGEQRLQRLKSLSSSIADPEAAQFTQERIAKLGQWHARGRSLLPLLSGMLE